MPERRSAGGLDVSIALFSSMSQRARAGGCGEDASAERRFRQIFSESVENAVAGSRAKPKASVIEFAASFLSSPIAKMQVASATVSPA